GQGGTAAFALDIVVNAARVRPLLPNGGIVLGELPGNCKPDRAARFSNGLRPCLNVGPIIDGEIVCVRARRNSIELDKIEAPGREERDDRVNVFLRSWLGEVDLVMVGKGRVGGESIALGKRYHDNILRVIRRAEDGIVAVNSRLLNAGDPIDTRLLPIGMDMVHHGLDIRERRAIRNGSSVLVEAALPARIEIDIDEA